MAKPTSLRVKKVQKALNKYGVDALIVQNPVDLHYLTELELSAGTLFITKNTAKLFVDGRYIETCKKHAPMASERSEEKVITAFLAKQKGISVIGFDATSTMYASYVQLRQMLKNFELRELVRPIEKIRAIKEAKEIKAIRKTCKLCEEGFEFLCSRVREGVTEKELACALEVFWLMKGADKLSFTPIVAFGKNSSMPHYRSGSTRLQPNDSILVDIGVVLDGYASDITRMIYYGTPNKKLIEIGDIVLKAQKKAIQAVKPGITSDALYAIAAKVIEKAGYKEAFLHSLGHGIGLEVHEYPYLRAKSAKDSVVLEPGMLITIEPGIYLPDLGGARFEDMILVTKDGHEELTTCPKFELIR